MDFVFKAKESLQHLKRFRDGYSSYLNTMGTFFGQESGRCRLRKHLLIQNYSQLALLLVLSRKLRNELMVL